MAAGVGDVDGGLLLVASEYPDGHPGLAQGHQGVPHLGALVTAGWEGSRKTAGRRGRQGRERRTTLTRWVYLLARPLIGTRYC